ncbi:DUF6701 domain-containing protein [Vibrio sp. TBV020]|uniref:DUF6701 domain-containing protein n=1 Tax=Vibrio sp. TBV020 TaxID=3137398 RepID=UPI0038CDA00B
MFKTTLKYLLCIFALSLNINLAHANCKYTPYAVQSWTDQGALRWHSNTPNIKIVGTHNKSGNIGIRVEGNFTNTPTCDSHICKEDSSLLIPEPDVVQLKLPGSDVVVPWNGMSLDSGSYNDITGWSGKLTLVGDVYHIKNYKFNGTLSLTQDTYLYVNTFEFGGGSSFEANGHQLFIWAENYSGNEANVKLVQPIKGDVFSRGTVELRALGQVNGRVTAKNIELYPDAQIINNDLTCEPPTEDDLPFEIKINPNNSHLMCETAPNNEVTVSVYDKEGKLLPGYIPNLKELNSSSLDISFVSEDNGISTYQVTKKDTTHLEDIDLIAALDTNGTKLTDTSKIKYVPFKFHIDDIDVFAGENKAVQLEVLACDDNNEVISLGYNGKPQATFGYIRPFNTNADQSDLAFDTASGGASLQASVNFIETGHINVELVDHSFTCSEEDHCPIDKGVLTGNFEIRSRPWKIAMCDISSDDGSTQNLGTSIASKGFLASGHPFNVTYRPIVHPDSSNTSSECSYPITYNYAKDSGPINLSYDISYPKSGTLGTLSSSNVAEFIPDSSGLLTVTHTWSEVGTFTLKANAHYLGLDTNTSEVDIGRFYPDFFSIDSNSWENPPLQSFTYMNQPFEQVTVDVSAFNKFGNKVMNYGLFDEKLKAIYEFNHLDRIANGDAGSLMFSSHYEGSTWKLASSDIYWRKQSDLLPDGPYNINQGEALDVSLRIYPSEVNDPVQFKDTPTGVGTNIQLLPDEQPSLLFGRMKLDDVNGPSGSPLTIPLSIEYWNGQRFETNTRDDVSLFDGDNHCIDNIWPTSSITNVQISGAGKVSSGTSSAIKAVQIDTYVKEKVKVSLNLNGTSSCTGADHHWLYFDWNQDSRSETPPSAIVTFGVFRGNDRIIFRGESGLFGK